MESILEEKVKKEEKKIFALFNLSSGRWILEERQSEKENDTGKRSAYLEIKVLTDDNKLAGIVWYFGDKRAYIDDIRQMISRKENQRISMVLIAGDGTTSAGKKELKEAGIEIKKDLSNVKVKSKRRMKRATKDAKAKDFSIDDDVAQVPENDLIVKAKSLAQIREPEIIKVAEIPGLEGVYDIKGYSSNGVLLIYYRTVDKKSIGVSVIRTLADSVDSGIQAPVGIIGPDKFTPSAKKEAMEKKINLVSLREEKLSEGNKETKKLTERLVSGAIEILENRGYTLMDPSDKRYVNLNAGSESLGTYLLAEKEEKGTKNLLLTLLPAEEVVRVATVRQFHEQIEALKVKSGMLIALKRFTYTADRECRKYNLIPLHKNHPVFDIFRHDLVPIHEVVEKKEIHKILQKYHCRLHQLPKIYNDDPGIVAINGQVGDVVAIYRSDDNTTYRIVIAHPDSDITAEPNLDLYADD